MGENHSDEDICKAIDSTELTATQTSESEIREIQSLVSRYVGQLLHGCGETTCTESLCDTGYRNICQRPVRKYTPRSARAIALTLASGPKPRSHLCSRFAYDAHKHLETVPEGKRDPTSSVQLLSDTETIRKLCEPNPTLIVTHLSARQDRHRVGLRSQFKEQHDALDKCLQTAPKFTGDPNIWVRETFDSGKALAQYLFSCISSLLEDLPRGNPSQWRSVDNMIRAGCVYPSQNLDTPCDPVFNTWLDSMDAIDYGPSSNVLCRALSVLGQISKSESEAIKVLHRDKNKPGHATSKALDHQTCSDVLGKFSTNEYQSVEQHLANLLCPGDEPLILRLNLIVWLKKIFIHYWEGGAKVTRGSLPWAALLLLSSLHRLCKTEDEADPHGAIFRIPIVPARLTAVDLVRSWNEITPPKASLSDGLYDCREIHLFQYSFIFTLSQHATYLRTMNHLRMRQANSNAEKAAAIHRRYQCELIEIGSQCRLKYLEDHYLLLNISRERILKDTFDQLWQRRKSELHRPLRVRLGEMDGVEIGHDLGGVQIEFFNLVCHELFRESAQMFTTDPTTGLSYFRPGSLQPLHMFELSGILFALAIYNGISLPVNLPLVFYQILADKELLYGTDLIADRWPVIKRSLDSLQDEDAADLERIFPLEANGLRLECLPVQFDCRHDIERHMQYLLVTRDGIPIVHHPDHEFSQHPREDHTSPSSTGTSMAIDIKAISQAWPGWRIIHPDNENFSVEDYILSGKTSYTSDYVQWLTEWSVAPQWSAFLTGFRSLSLNLSSIPTHDLRSIIECSTHFDIDELRRVTQYDGYEAQSKYMQGFWRIVSNWLEEKQKQLLKFVTACERIPAGGAGKLTFRIQRSTPASGEYLPTSSTCFGTLMLPKYESMATLEKKLSLALKFGGEGFGTG